MQENTNLALENNNQTVSSSIQPMSLTDILDGMFALYRNNFLMYLKIVVVYFIFAYTAEKIALLLMFEGGTSDILLMTTFFYLLGTFLLTHYVVGVLSYATAQVFLDRNITARGALQHTLRHYLPFLGCYVVYILVVSGLSITIIGIPFAIYMIIRWGLYTLPALFEETTTMRSLRRSSDLVRGTWWRVLGIILAIFLIILMIQFILSGTFNFVYFLITGIRQIQGTNLFDTIYRFITSTPIIEVDWTAYLIQSFVLSGINALIMPIASIGSTLLYFDLRIRKEAYDIEMRVSD